MPYLAVTVAVVGVLCVLNLLLTTGVIRRLREHTELLSTRGGEPPYEIIAAGERPGEFAATDVDGLPVRRDDVEGSAVVAFFSPDCPACTEGLPGFVEFAGRFPGGREKVLAVVAGGLADDGSPATDAEALITALRAVTRVVPEEPEGRVAAAFGIGAFPSWVQMEGSLVGASGVGMERLPSPAPA